MTSKRPQQSAGLEPAAVTGLLRGLAAEPMPDWAASRIDAALRAEARENAIIDLTEQVVTVHELVEGEYTSRRRKSTA